jgi:hypothetical protein
MIRAIEERMRVRPSGKDGTVSRPQNPALVASLLPLLICPSLLAGQKPALRGKAATVTLLSSLSSKLSNGSSFQARLVKPLELDQGVVLPPGTLLAGTVRTIRARRLHRVGSLRLIFHTISIPGGAPQAGEFALLEIRNKNLKLDSEGTVKPCVTAKRRALEIGMAVAFGKVADDVSETIIGSLTPGKARIFGMGGGLAFYFLRRGRDVTLPEGTVMEVTVGRAAAVSVIPTQEKSSADSSDPE